MNQHSSLMDKLRGNTGQLKLKLHYVMTKPCVVQHLSDIIPQKHRAVDCLSHSIQSHPKETLKPGEFCVIYLVTGKPGEYDNDGIRFDQIATLSNNVHVTLSACMQCLQLNFTFQK